MGGTFVSHQRNYVRTDRLALQHDVDLHWKTANPVALCDLLPFDELWRGATRFPLADDVDARAPGACHAVLLACLHRASHHYDSDDLLWLVDIHLLVERFTAAERADAIGVILRAGAGAICRRALQLARDRFGTRGAADLLDALTSSGSQSAELPSIYLRPDVSKADLLRADLATVPGIGKRVRLLKEHLFPPASYMLRGAGVSGRWTLPARYALRIVRGARGWFRPIQPAADRDRRRAMFDTRGGFGDSETRSLGDR
jgi:hypothetical protein